MKHEMKEKLWKFTCVVSEVQCESQLSLYTQPFSIPILAIL